ncbi:DUF308 domain-containing protein [Leucobacter soli]|uniref:HdeD family acid-resistance protein n=1 Tax=Leucobacter soli TaxID=2812850 RepID=A0A916JWW2_9MICO|nr:DUF308 domain-containing protein [Leucobacter soli]CAG7611198.1 hypothetical protein LEUCIP111803_01405 [Leucobacter soli]
MTWEIVPDQTPPNRNPGGRSPWWLLVAVGALVSAAGAALLVWPFIAATWLLSILFGTVLIANGLAILVRGRGPLAAVGGVVLLLAGVLAILFAEFTAGAIVTFFAVALLALGAAWLILGLGLAQRGSALVVAPALLLMLAGIFGLVWPSVALALIAVVAGLCTLALGASMIWGALALRRAVKGPFGSA